MLLHLMYMICHMLTNTSNKAKLGDLMCRFTSSIRISVAQFCFLDFELVDLLSVLERVSCTRKCM